MKKDPLVFKVLQSAAKTLLPIDMFPKEASCFRLQLSSYPPPDRMLISTEQPFLAGIDQIDL
jgi:hypothetical protein